MLHQSTHQHNLDGLWEALLQDGGAAASRHELEEEEGECSVPKRRQPAYLPQPEEGLVIATHKAGGEDTTTSHS